MSRKRGEGGRFAEKASLDDVLAVLDERGEPMTGTEVGDALGVSNRSALDKLNELHDRDAVKRKKVGGRSVVWWIDNSTFARELSRKSIAAQYGDDYFAQNPGWADDLPDLGENA